MKVFKCLDINWAVNPGQVVKLPLLIAETKVDLVGQTAVVRRLVASSDFFV